jgi:hypothetical protein
LGYYLQAIICNQADTSLLTDNFKKAVNVNLKYNLSLIPMTEDLFDEINNLKESNQINNFIYLTENIESEILKYFGNRRVAYIEAEYHGGNGGQMALVWKNNKREYLLEYGQDKINKVLKDFGVVAKAGEDEFLTAGFGLRRNTIDWTEADE